MISRLLTLTAWSMTPPAVWSPFHLVFMLIGIPLAAFAAWKLRTRSEAFRLHLLFACGIFLAFSEVYKQLFLYYIENNRHYDWWYFPFQLCSLPMYLCPLFRINISVFFALLCIITTCSVPSWCSSIRPV